MEPRIFYLGEARDLFHLDKLGVLTVHSKRSLYDKQWTSFRWSRRSVLLVEKLCAIFLLF